MENIKTKRRFFFKLHTATPKMFDNSYRDVLLYLQIVPSLCKGCLNFKEQGEILKFNS